MQVISIFDFFVYNICKFLAIYLFMKLVFYIYLIDIFYRYILICIYLVYIGQYIFMVPLFVIFYQIKIIIIIIINNNNKLIANYSVTISYIICLLP